MKSELALDLINFVNGVILFVAPLILNALKKPIEVQLSPFVFLAVPLVIAWYRRRTETQTLERLKVIQKAGKLQPLLFRLGKLKNIPTIATALLNDKRCLLRSNKAAVSGWRSYFDTYSKTLDEKFCSFESDLKNFVTGAKNREKEAFFVVVVDFYWIVSKFQDFYSKLVEMVEFAGGIPLECKDISEWSDQLYSDYKEFYDALKGLCAEDEEIRRKFEGKKPLEVAPKKLPVRKEKIVKLS